MRAKDILSKNVVEVQKNEQVSKLAGRMEKLSARSAYIMDQKEFLGIFSLTNFLKSRSDISQLKADLFVKKVAHLDAEDSLMKVAKQMLNSDSFLLPVYENKEFFGVIEIFDFFEGILESKEFTWLKDIKATELRKDKMFVHEKEKISAALTKMAGKRRELPVVGDYFKVAGVLNHGDLLQRYYSFYLRPEHRQKPRTQTRAYEGNPAKIPNLPVKNFIVREEPVYIDKDENMQNMVRLMTQQKVLSVMIKNSLETISAKEILRKIHEFEPTEKILVQFVGLHKIMRDDQENSIEKRLQAAAEHYIKKISRHFKGRFNVIVHIKEHDREGKRSRYEVHTRLHLPTTPIAAKTEDWNLVTAVRKSFDEVIEQIESKFKKRMKKKQLKFISQIYK